MKRRIFTHINGDIDSFTSIWFASRFLYKQKGDIFFTSFSKEKSKEEEIFFVSASWDGFGLRENDLALDISAGDLGIKGDIDKKGRVHSCFFKLVNEYADEDTKKILISLARSIDKHDAYGLSAFVNNSDQQIRSYNDLVSALRYLKRDNENDAAVMPFVFSFLDGFYQVHVDKINSKKDILDNIISVGKTALFIKEEGKKTLSSRSTIFEKLGFEAMVYVNGNELGIIIKDSLIELGIRSCNPETKKIIEKAGETESWYNHPSGFLYAWSSRKAPKQNMSEVDPYELALQMEKFRKEIFKKMKL